MITGIAHLAMATADMKAALHFYCDQLGFTHAFSLQDNDGNPWIEYVKVKEGQFLEFFYADGKLDNAQSTFRHLCLEVDDIHAQAKAMEAAGIFIRVQPNQGKDLNWQCWVDDPDGNPIELMQIDPASPQAKG
jgi:lactoylglutathione lyase